ncbi:SDR family NAD(P)-dependent oxidoreductase [Sorangium cellulosum]|uniref:2-deoxy-D-gluconate 3-dehydrogenase n=1 Tax=Sorangium cellulosum TaxID=56 RepID=A0A150R108_SORCE|nr:SDR family oxidoreductase [Sorangium cellulosum]KYF73905.1 2-deoxy-D-gluconate 3-dehydrogenase [Sorangium cellulosum]
MTTLFDIAGRTAVVVGGTSGIGRAIALGLAEAGVHTVASGTRADRAKAVTKEIRARGARSVEATCDVGDRASIDALRDSVVQALGGVDILVNCAGRTFRKPTAEVADAEWSSLLDTNVTGMLRACQSFHGPLKESGRGRIVNIASLSSFVAFHEVAAYGASKAAVLALTKSLGAEWARDGIRTNAIVPGVFVTDLNRALLEGTPRGQELLTRTPLGRFGEAIELIGAALFLCSDAVSFITGTSIAVDGGFLASGVNQ